MRAFLIVLAVVLVAMAGFLGVIELAIARHNPCGIYGDPPAGARVSEANSAVIESVSFWPLGSVCDWPRKDGEEGSVHSYVGSYPATVTVYGLLAGGVAAAAGSLAVRTTARPRRTSV